MMLFKLFVLSAFLSFNVHAAKVGEAAPQFKLKDQNGKEHSLSDFKGKYVVLEWFNHDCPFVKKHYSVNNMQNLQKEYTSKGAVWLTIISSAPGKQGHLSAEQAKAKFAELKMASNAILLDESGEVGKAYAAKVTPHMYVINPEGKLLYNGAIDSNSSSDSKTISGATNYVKAALDSAMNGKAIEVTQNKPYGCSVKYN